MTVMEEKNAVKNSGQRSLLSKTLMQFAVSVSLCFMVTVPLFYLLTKYYYAEDMMDIIEAVEQGQAIPQLDLEEDIIAGMMLQFLLIFIVITLAIMITVRWITPKLWMPFDDTLRKAERFNLAQGELPRFVETDIQEFDRLNKSLNKLMCKDKETYRIQKEFTENASHELQTPLAIIRSKLDLLMQEDLNEEQMNLVADLYNLTVRMDYLNRNLLLLAKIDNRQYSAMEKVDVVALLNDSLPLYATLRQDMNMELEDRRTDKSSAIEANPVLLECMLKNLVVNAIRHSASCGNIRLLVEDGRLTVSNTSVDGRPLDGTTLFQRFRTSGDERQKGNGLGLAIVKAICDFHHWTVEYRMENHRHLFIVNFGSGHQKS